MSGPGTKRGTAEADRSLSPPPVKRRFESTTTNKAVTSFFTPLSQKKAETINWRVAKNSLLVGTYRPNAEASMGDARPEKRRKIAAFDFDSTLIQTSSGNIFGKSATDWRWWHTSVPGELKRLYDNGYLVVILSNQGGVSLGTDSKTPKQDLLRLSQFKAKVAAVFTQLDIPISIYAATTRDQYRKPRVGMWKELLEDHDLDIGDGPDLTASYFVGDAAGRTVRADMKADHSSTDRGFASNLRIEFKTPEEYFLKDPPRPFTQTFDPIVFLDSADTSHKVNHNLTQSVLSSPQPNEFPVAFEKCNELDIVMLCGSPGSGKSTFYWNTLQPFGYERVNQDILKSRDRCLKVAIGHLSSKRSVAVDNTNADPDTRGSWVKLAQTADVPIRCVYFTTPAKVCQHNDTVRALNQGIFNPEKRTILPHSAFSGYSARFVEPKAKEGFQDILRVPFQFHGTEESRRIWSLQWI